MDFVNFGLRIRALLALSGIQLPLEEELSTGPFFWDRLAGQSGPLAVCTFDAGQIFSDVQHTFVSVMSCLFGAYSGGYDGF